MFLPNYNHQSDTGSWEALWNFLNCIINISAATRLASKSETGMLTHTPSSPKKWGRMSKQGNKINN